jgi:hypothetical protein
LSTLKFETFFCDDIRQEANGKYLIIGLYPTDLVPGAVPSSFPLSALVRITGLSAGHHHFVAKVAGPDGPQAELIGEGDNAEGPVVFALPGLPVTVNRYGEITLTLAFDGGADEVAGVLPVSRRRDPVKKT